MGPLPAPEDFQRYETVLPGSANTILQMAQREQKARIQANGLRESRLRTGMFLGGLLPYMSLVIAVVAMVLGHPPTGIAFGGLGILVPVVNAIMRKVGSNDSAVAANGPS